MPENRLVIVESPTKAETIKRYLDKNYTVVASKGHVRDLPEDSMAIDVEHGFAPEYVVSEGKGELIKELKRKLKGCDELLLATDEDREGESISWHLVEVLKPQVPYRRMVFHEITRSAIQEALKGGRDLDMNLVRAQEDRRIIDRLFGYEVSPVLWRKLSNKKLSGGRVQSVGLRFIVEKELERMNYKASQYCDIKADFGSFSAMLESTGGEKVATRSDFDPVTGEFDNKARLLTEEDCQKIIEHCQNNPHYEVISVVMKPGTSNPQPPFTTSTLQQAASSRLHLSSKETMRLAQSLFENGFITYMRTDSVNLSSECIDAARKQIVSEFGQDYLSDSVRTFRNKSKNAQEAHEAIRPAGDSFRTPAQTGLKGKELALYALIWMRTLATQMASAKKSTTTVRLENGDNVFVASGTTVLFPGYLRVYKDDAGDDEKGASLPAIKEGDVFTYAELSSNLHTTSAPARYTEASLIRKLEEQGIGRPSTYASIISTLLDRGYVNETDRTMIPTFTGFAVNACMMNAFSQLVDYSYTSDMEDELDKIASGSEDSRRYLETFYYGNEKVKGLRTMVQEARETKDDYKTLSFPNFSGKATLRDGRECTYSIKIGPYGAYLATSLLKDDGKSLIVNIPAYELPGNMNDDDIARMISDDFLGHSDEGDRIILKRGPRGEYWQKGDRITGVPRGKKKAGDYTEEEIEYMLSLPREVGKDDDGEVITVNKGPYGFYLKYKGESYKLFSLNMNMTREEALEVIGRKTGSSAKKRDMGKYEDLEATIIIGKFGPYLKWGGENIRLEKKDLDAFTMEDVENAIKSMTEKKASSSQAVLLGNYEGSPVTLHSGRYGKYLKWNGKNYSLQKNMDGTIDLEFAKQTIMQHEKTRNPQSLGDLDGDPILLANGRYGYYLKYRGNNYRIPSSSGESITFAEASTIIRQSEEARSRTQDSIGDYLGQPVTLASGRYGYYLKWNGRNIALPASLKSDPDSLTLEKAIEIIEKKTKD